MSRGLALALALAATSAPSADARALDMASPLALPVVEGDALERPTLILAQRAITREWGPSQDSLYQVIEVPEWRSEGLAMALSAAVPGTGQFYVGDPAGIWFLLAEAVGWTANLVLDDQADDARAEAESFAGDPTVAASNWSFERWTDATNGDPAELQTMYDGDPSSFYRVIGMDARYLEGWSGNAPATRGDYVTLQDKADDKRKGAHIATGVIVLNHVLSAAHAFRAARLHNMPLRRNIELQLKPTWTGDGPTMMAVVRGRF
jgi:hypothetical protein